MRRILHAEIVPLHGARETLTLGCTRDVYALTILENVYLDIATGGQILAFTVREAKLPEFVTGVYLSFGKMTQLCFGYSIRLTGAHSHLNSPIPVTVSRLQL
jgi:hypothetical protein